MSEKSISRQRSHLINLKNVATLILQCLDLPPAIDLLSLRVLQLVVSLNSFLQNLGDIWHRPSRSAKVKATLLLKVSATDVTESLSHAVLNVDLLGLVT